MTALLTDLYELTMAAALFAEGRAEVPATFSLSVRSLPPSRGFLVVAGLEDALAHVAGLRFTREDRAALAALGLFDPAFLDWLGEVRFTGSLRGIPEGRVAFAGEPLLEVRAPFAVAQMLETYLLNQLTYQTALATKAARCRHAARGRAVVDFALRRAHGAEAGMRVARAAAICGLAGTSNVAGAVRYGSTATGTMAHSYVSAHAAWGTGGEMTEVDAFRSFARHYRGDPVLLVDTYDTLAGVDRAVAIAAELAAEGRRLAAVRLDSGDLAALARAARARLDAAGLDGVRIFASGGLDEFEIDRLLAGGAPIDGFGVGTRLGVSEDAPTLETVYKLVEVDGRPVAKHSEGKASLPGAKQVWRRPGGAGDVLGLAGEAADGGEPLLVEVAPAPAPDGAAAAAAVAAAARRFEADWAALGEEHKRLVDPAPYPVELSAGLGGLVGGRLTGAVSPRMTAGPGAAPA